MRRRDSFYNLRCNSCSKYGCNPHGYERCSECEERYCYDCIRHERIKIKYKCSNCFSVKDNDIKSLWLFFIIHSTPLYADLAGVVYEYAYP